MNENQLSKRLQRVGEFVPDQARLADIGSDHAYLPVALLLQNKLSFCVAGEVVKGPYDSALSQVVKNGLQAKITVRLADGLDAIEPADQIDAITICGMGGVLIRDILEAGKCNRRLTGEERLILQPNVGEKNVREWLAQHDYCLIEEAILEENDKIYEIIVAEKAVTPVSYSNQELLFGPFLVVEKSPVFIKKWRQELKQREYVLQQLRKASHGQQDKIQQFEQEVATIKEVLMHES